MRLVASATLCLLFQHATAYRVALATTESYKILSIVWQMFNDLSCLRYFFYTYTMEQVDDGALNSKAGLVGELQGKPPSLQERSMPSSTGLGPSTDSGSP